MARCKKDKEFADDARLLRWWQAWHREQREAVLAGPHGVALSELFRMFKNLRHAQPSQLSGFARSINWSTIDYDTKLVVVHELNTAIAAFRERTAWRRLTTTCQAKRRHHSGSSARSYSLLPLTMRAPTEAELGPSNSHRSIQEIQS
jgi:hypothetical protein